MVCRLCRWSSRRSGDCGDAVLCGKDKARQKTTESVAEVQLGTFILLLVFPVASFAFILTVREWTIPKYVTFLMVGLFGIISLAAISLMFFGNYDVVISESIPDTIANALEYNSTGDLQTNSTTTVAGYSNTSPIINAFHQELGWIFFVFTMAWGLMYLYVMLAPFMGRLG